MKCPFRSSQFRFSQFRWAMAGLTAIIALTSTPVSARPAMVERLAELQARGSGDRKGLSDSYHHNREVERPSGVVRESTQPPKYVERPAVHHRLAELQSRGHRDRRGVVYDTHKGYEFETQSGVVTENTEHLGYVPREETNIERPAMVERLRRMNRDGRLNERGVL